MKRKNKAEILKEAEKKHSELMEKIEANEKIKLEYSRGNEKIGSDTIIINFTSAENCPAKKLGLCKHCNICYARKAEIQYPSVLPYRKRQALQWDYLSAENIAEQIKGIAKRARIKIKYLRFSESGDFKNQNDVEKINKIAYLLQGIMRVYGYTARQDLEYNNLSSNITINGSGFLVSNNFKILYPTEKKAKNEKLCVGNCRCCNLCKVSSGQTIRVMAH